jgi:hypothetical protein
VVKGRAEVFAAPDPIPKAVRECVDWLAAMDRKIEQTIPDEPEIAVIPLGALNLLPFNAAFIQATADRPAHQGRRNCRGRRGRKLWDLIRRLIRRDDKKRAIEDRERRITFVFDEKPTAAGPPRSRP